MSSQCVLTSGFRAVLWPLVAPIRGSGLFWVTVGLLAAGCAETAPPPAMVSALPPAVPVRAGPREAQVQRFDTLLGFEEESDRVFLGSDSQQAVRDARRARTGRCSLAMPAGTDQLTIKLSSLLSGRTFPGDWTLAGAYFLADSPVRVSVACQANGQTFGRASVLLPAGKWTGVFADVTAASAAPADQTMLLIFRFDSPRPVPLWCDDVMLIDDNRTLVGPADSTSTWTIRHRGFQTIVDSPRRFHLTLQMPPAAPDGWQVEEANAVRLRLRSTGEQKVWTIYADGREYVDGQYCSTLDRANPYAQDFAEQHRSPARLSVAEEQGRVDRNSPGDEHNDGYNQQTASYRLIAYGPRLQVTLCPQTQWLVSPVLEVAGLPAGKIRVTVEGQLIAGALRLPDGHTLIPLPVRMERPTTVNINVE